MRPEFSTLGTMCQKETTVKTGAEGVLAMQTGKPLDAGRRDVSPEVSGGLETPAGRQTFVKRTFGVGAEGRLPGFGAWFHAPWGQGSVQAQFQVHNKKFSAFGKVNAERPEKNRTIDAPQKTSPD